LRPTNYEIKITSLEKKVGTMRNQQRSITSIHTMIRTSTTGIKLGENWKMEHKLVAQKKKVPRRHENYQTDMVLKTASNPLVSYILLR
jgi:hypothetical protein